MEKALKTLQDANELEKLEIVKKLMTYYCVANKLDQLNEIIPTPPGYKKYGTRLLGEYIARKIDSVKRHIAGVITSIGNDEKLDEWHERMIIEY